LNIHMEQNRSHIDQSNSQPFTIGSIQTDIQGYIETLHKQIGELTGTVTQLRQEVTDLKLILLDREEGLGSD